MQLCAKEDKAFRLLQSPTYDTSRPSAEGLLFSPDSKRLAIPCSTGDGRFALSVVDTLGGNCVLTVPDLREPRVASSPDGQLLAALHGSQGIVLYDFYAQSRVEVPFSSYLEAVAFSPDGTFLAAACFEELHIFRRPKWQVRRKWPIAAASLQFSPDGRWLAVAADRTIRLLDMSQGGAQYASLSLDTEVYQVEF
jgi:WD40 repeat protein